MYQEAAAAEHDLIAAIGVRVLELERHPYPADVSTTPEEVAAAATLARTIAEAQAARIPDLSEVRQVLADAARTLGLAELAGVRPVTPDAPGVTEPEPLPQPLSDAGDAA